MDTVENNAHCLCLELVQGSTASFSVALRRAGKRPTAAADVTVNNYSNNSLRSGFPLLLVS